MFTLSFVDGGMPRAHRLREGETVIGRAPTCEVVITAPLMSRQHARVRVAGGRVFVRDAGSTYGTTVGDAPITGECELRPGDTFSVGQVTITLESDVQESELLSESHQLFEESSAILKSIIAPGPPVAAIPAAVMATPAGPTPVGRFTMSRTRTRTAIEPPTVARTTEPTAAPLTERRVEERRKVNFGRAAGDRRSGHDRRGGRILKLLTEIGKTLVTVQPLEQVLARVVDLVFDVLPAERTFLLLRDAMDQPLTARVMRSRDGSVPTRTTLSRTIVNKVMRERVAMLASDALYDSRLDASSSIQAMNIRSFMCAPLWNRNEVIGVLYCDNPRSKKFTADDLEVFAALCNYAAVAIEQARLSSQLLEETRRRERLQRYHSPGVVGRILHGAQGDGGFAAQTRDVTVMFCDIVGFTSLCEHVEPQAIGEMLNQFFERMAEVIFEHDGTLDKFIGDAILAVFGAPLDQPDHAIRAVSAALAMRAELARSNAQNPDRPIRMRIAINSGPALTGDIGSPKRREFTVLGDVVNTASRMESSIAEPDQIIISEHTRRRLHEGFTLRPIKSAALRGRDGRLEMFEVLG
jgi:adenylate cyclase